MSHRAAFGLVDAGGSSDSELEVKVGPCSEEGGLAVVSDVVVSHAATADGSDGSCHVLSRTTHASDRRTCPRSMRRKQ